MNPLCRVLPVVVALSAAVMGYGQADFGEFDAHGTGVVRVEHEAKLRVPDEKVEIVWEWLQKRYADCSWLDGSYGAIIAKLGDEDFTDTYFDTGELQLLKEKSGVRHRHRNVVSGAAAAKDERNLIQLKINRADATGLARSEIKYEVSVNGEATVDEEAWLLPLVKSGSAQECVDTLRALGINAHKLRAKLHVNQRRRRVYLYDIGGALATLTLDQCEASAWGVSKRWVEIELELNEIRFTEAQPAEQGYMLKAIEHVQSDLVTAHPDIIQDQTPKYNKAFAAIESETWIPIRLCGSWGLTPLTVRFTLPLVLISLLGWATVGGARAIRLRRADRS